MEEIAKKITSEMVYVTPEMADEWLGTIPEFQRNERKLHTEELAFAMANGEWKATGADAIVISDRGRLINGAHRCRACVVCGQSFWSLVTHGVSEDAYSAIDCGAKRSLGERIDCTSKEVAFAVASMMWLRGETIMSSVSGNRYRSVIGDGEVHAHIAENRSCIAGHIRDYEALRRTVGRLSTKAYAIAATRAEAMGQFADFNLLVSEMCDWETSLKAAIMCRASLMSPKQKSAAEQVVVLCAATEQVASGYEPSMPTKAPTDKTRMERLRNND